MHIIKLLHCDGAWMHLPCMRVSQEANCRHLQFRLWVCVWIGSRSNYRRAPTMEKIKVFIVIHIYIAFNFEAIFFLSIFILSASIHGKGWRRSASITARARKHFVGKLYHHITWSTWYGGNSISHCYLIEINDNIINILTFGAGGLGALWTEYKEGSM